MSWRSERMPSKNRTNCNLEKTTGAPGGGPAPGAALGPDALEEQDQLQLEEAHRIDGGPPGLGVELTHQIAHEAEVERPLQMAVEVFWGDKVLQRHRGQRIERP